MALSQLVSCIMPTGNRRRFVGQSIWYFLRQDHSQKELIVLDDDEDVIADLVPNDERIRSVRLDRRLSLGGKPNLECELSMGSLSAHWDDDDWMSAERLSIQVASPIGKRCSYLWRTPPAVLQPRCRSGLDFPHSTRFRA